MAARYYSRQILIFLFLLSLVQSSFANTAIILDHDFLINSGFENGDSGWLGISAGIEVDQAVSFMGEKSLHFLSANTKREVLSEPSRIQYTSNTRYRVATSFKNSSSEGTVKLGIKLTGENYEEQCITLPLPLINTSSWKDASFIFEVPLSTPPARNIQLCLLVDQDYAGEVWFDELSLQAVLPGKNLMINGGFENKGASWSLRKSVVDDQHKLSGDWSVRMAASPGDWNNIITNSEPAQVPILNSQDSYLVTCYYLMEKENTHPEYLWPRIRYIAADGKSAGYANFKSDISKHGEWIKFQESLNYMDKAAKMSINFLADPSLVGYVWIDDFEFLRIPATTPAQITGFTVDRTSLEQIECNWDGISEEPFKYNLYISTEAIFTPDESNLYATLDGNVTSLQYKIPQSRLTNKFYFALAAVDEGGQEGEFAVSEAKGAAKVQFELEIQDTAEALVEAKIAIEGKPEIYTDSTGKTEIILLEGTYPCTIRKQGVIREECVLVISGVESQVVKRSLKTDSTPPNAVEVNVDDSIPGLAILTWAVPEAAASDGDFPSYYIVYKSINKDDLVGSSIVEDFKVAEVTGESEVGKNIEWQDKDVVGETTYHYVIVAFDLADNPAYSNLVSAAIVTAPAPTVISPKAKKPFLEDIVFEWIAMKGVEAYTIDISKDASFPEETKKSYQVSKGNTSYSLTEELSKGVWYWRMQAHLETGADSRYSQVETFVMMEINEDSLPIAYFTTSGLYNPMAGALEISYVLKEAGKVNISIYTKEGRFVKKITNWEPKASGVHYNYWDGKWNGMTVLNGLYFIKLEYDNGSQKTNSFNKLFVWKE